MRDTLNKTPTVARFFVVLACLAGHAGLAFAQTQSQPWSVEDTVARAVSNPEFEVLLEHQLEGLRAGAREATTVPTPTIDLGYEQVFGGESVANAEYTATLQQSFDLSGWRSHLRGGVANRESAHRAQIDERRLLLSAVVRLAFFEIRFREERLRAFEDWTRRIEEGVLAISARESAGDAAPYTVGRILRELETAQAAMASEASALEEAWSTLAALVPWESRPVLTGDVRPRATGDGASEPLDLPSLARFEFLDAALDEERRAWGRPFLRGWAIGAGYRYSEVASADGHGVIVSLSLPLSFWNNDAPRLERLDAERAELASELSLLSARAERAATAAETRLQRSLEALDALAATDDVTELTGLAEIAYAANEATLTELLDAYESETELRLSRLDLEWAARRAAIELDRRTGRGFDR